MILQLVLFFLLFSFFVFLPLSLLVSLFLFQVIVVVLVFCSSSSFHLLSTGLYFSAQYFFFFLISNFGSFEQSKERNREQEGKNLLARKENLTLQELFFAPVRMLKICLASIELDFIVQILLFNFLVFSFLKKEK